MGLIYIDGEKVEFEGEPPRLASDAIAIVEQYLSSQGRSIGGVEIDGSELPLETAVGVAGFASLSIRSVSLRDQLGSLCRQWSGDCAGRAARARAVSIVLLRSSWQDCQRKSVEFLESLRPLIEGLGVVQAYGEEIGADWRAPFSSAFEAGIAAIDLVADAVEARDCVALAERMGGAVAESWERIGEELEKRVIASLEASPA